jgi:hypothetical protein
MTRARFCFVPSWLCATLAVLTMKRFLLAALLFVPCSLIAAEPAWVQPMRKAHARFTGTPGTFAQLGDSITVTMAFWAPLQSKPKNMSPEAARAHELVTAYQRPECWRGWKGPEFGSNGSMTIRWADKNIEAWLKKLNPEVAVILFGTNDMGDFSVKEFEAKVRAVVDRCLQNGTIPILTTPPPRSGRGEKSEEFSTAVRQVATELHLPLCDFYAEVMRRRPNDWDGSLPKFKEFPGGEYDVPTLIARDGVHPSAPQKFANDFSESALNSNGYNLRNYLTLLAYAEVIEKVCQAGAGKR